MKIRGSDMTPIPESLTDDPPSVGYILPVRSLAGYGRIFVRWFSHLAIQL